MEVDTLEVFGAREHNLQDIDISIPREKLVVITGVSGSGKSSLAFDTIYAEGQRRYLDTFSIYIRQFIGDLQRPDVDKINGLSPVIAIDQKTTSRNPRSTVGTVTEIYDFIRLLYARIGEAYSYVTGNRMEKLSDDEIVKRIAQKFDTKQIVLLAPVVKGRKGHYKEDFEKIRKQGYTRARVDGELVELKAGLQLDRYKIHDIEVVIDRIEITGDYKSRLYKSVVLALNYGKGSMLMLDSNTNVTHWYCRTLMDPESGISYDEPSPNSFSFNSVYGYCRSCVGLGLVMLPNVEAIVADPNLPMNGGGLAPLDKLWGSEIDLALRHLGKKYNFTTTNPFKLLPPDVQQIVLYGEPEIELPLATPDFVNSLVYHHQFIGIGNYLNLLYLTRSEAVKWWAEKFLNPQLCPTCNGARIKQESLYFKIGGKNIYEVASMQLSTLKDWFANIETQLSKKQILIATELLKEIRKRIDFLVEIGLEYLTLSRSAKTLSGGEAQRIRLATQIGSQLMGVLYILDEPSIGLHQRDNQKLIQSLKNLRDLGNSIIVVEHDKEMMLSADYLVDIGPGAGEHGGKIVATGEPSQFLDIPTVTADYLTNRRKINTPKNRRKPKDKFLTLSDATGNNLKNVTLHLPLELLVCISGVSGSGKSSLINHTLYPILHQHIYKQATTPLTFRKIEGLEHIDKVIEIDQKPIGRTPRSNSATYTGVFSFIRDLFCQLPESLIRGYKPGRFSFNVKGGRCETCGGGGVQVIEMNFLPDVQVECPTCRGKRYNRETLEVRYKGKSISDVLNMTVGDGLAFFQPIPRIKNKLQALYDVGLGYLHIGQPATTLSGGEAQRMKIATELGKRDTGKTIYLLDEPTTGLHFQDIEVLLRVLNQLVDKRNTVIVIEHNLDVIKVADWVIDLGPEGGNGGGHIIAQGTPEAIAKHSDSYTGRFLKGELK